MPMAGENMRRQAVTLPAPKIPTFYDTDVRSNVDMDYDEAREKYKKSR